MCWGVCDIFFFLGRRKMSPFLLLRQSMLRWPRGSRRLFFFYGITGVLSSRTAPLDAL